MCDCIKYKQFFTESNDEEFFLLKEELSPIVKIPKGMSLEDYKIYKTIEFPTETARQRYIQQSRIKSGLCVRCGKPAKQNSDGTFQQYCEKHAEEVNLRFQSRRKLGLCRKCKNPAKLNPDGTFHQYCEKHADEINVRLQSKFQTLRKSGLCILCGEPAKQNSDGTFQQYCEKHAEQYNKRRKSLKKSGRCVKCGEPAKQNSDGTYQSYCEKHAEQSNQVRQLKRQSGLCVLCGDPTKQNSDGTFQQHCEKHAKQLLLRRRFKKQNAVDYKGGECAYCGYKKSIAAMDFHHTDPSQKDKKWDSMIYGKPFDEIKNELDKCILLCKNCHSTIHYKVEKSKMSQRREDRKKACLEYKNTNSCNKCKTTGVSRILQFHHIGLKDPNFSRFFQWPDWTIPENWKIEYEKTGKLPERIQNELDKCEVLCANCHAEAHYNPATGDTTEEFDKEIPEEECTDDMCKHSHT